MDFSQLMQINNFLEIGNIYGLNLQNLADYWRYWHCGGDDPFPTTDTLVVGGLRGSAMLWSVIANPIALRECNIAV
jgi:hypothetical protein